MTAKKRLQSVVTGDICSMSVRAHKIQKYCTCIPILLCMFQCCYLSSGKFWSDNNETGMLRKSSFVAEWPEDRSLVVSVSIETPAKCLKMDFREHEKYAANPVQCDARFTTVIFKKKK